MSETYFFDTYALFEIIRGNPKYEKYTDSKAITTAFNIAELNYNLKKLHSKKIADFFTKKFKQCTVRILWDDIINAMDLKIQYKDLSIPDVVGYIVAKRSKVKFLTGDEGFKSFENVEFVKK